jgi:glycerophosphoryl diester phosphodiesterase
MPSRPIWAIAHRVNDWPGIQRAIDSGANAIECDIHSGVVDHDGPFPFSTTWATWFRFAALAARTRPGLALFYFDIKDPAAIYGLVDRVHQHGLHASGARIVYSVPALSMSGILRGNVPRMTGTEGICVDMEDGVAAVDSFFAGSGTDRCWYGNGITAALPAAWGGHASVLEAIRRRDSGGSAIRKVCVWTLERESSIRSYLEAGVDAVMVNRRALFAVRTAVDSTPGLHLATREDAAF